MMQVIVKLHRSQWSTRAQFRGPI